MYHLLAELLTMLQSEVVHESKDAWLGTWREYHYVGEWQLVFGAICETLYIYHVYTNERTYSQIKRIGEVLFFNKPEMWEQLRPYVQQ